MAVASTLYSKSNVLWLAAYVVALSGIVLFVLRLRETTLTDMATPEAQTDWQTWRTSKPNQAGGPVARRPPKADEPPALLLMRDHFAVVMSGSVLFGSLLFAAIMMAARGVYSSRPLPSSDEDRAKSNASASQPPR